MRNAESLSQEQIRDFLKSSQADRVWGCGRDEKYRWVECVLGAQNYGELGKRDRGVVRGYVEKVTGMSAAQTTRLIRAFLDHGVVRAAPYQRHHFPEVGRCAAPSFSYPALPAVERNRFHAHRSIRKCYPPVRTSLPDGPQ